MSSTEPHPIGGYLEWELPPARRHYHEGAMRLHTGRVCFAYLLMRHHLKKVHIPYFICNSVLEPIIHHRIEYEFYRIDRNFEIVDLPSLHQDEQLLYVNYYGLKENYAASLAEHYGAALIVDNTHSFFAPPESRASTFYSPRKFFGVPDGGYVMDSSPKVESVAEMPYPSIEYSHLAGRLEDGPEAHYAEYQRSEEHLAYDGIRRMSRLSERILASVDYEWVRAKRQENFQFLHDALGTYNAMDVTAAAARGPLCYPLRVESDSLRAKLIKNRVFVPIYWSEVIPRIRDANSAEVSLVKNILPLPIDQRYSQADGQRIVELIKSEL